MECRWSPKTKNKRNTGETSFSFKLSDMFDGMTKRRINNEISNLCWFDRTPFCSNITSWERKRTTYVFTSFSTESITTNFRQWKGQDGERESEKTHFSHIEARERERITTFNDLQQKKENQSSFSDQSWWLRKWNRICGIYQSKLKRDSSRSIFFVMNIWLRRSCVLQVLINSIERNRRNLQLF